ncbi:Uncharacterised protein [Mycobacteroides abscessus subsp. abscessus]|nr:Uncharacterised protein [Mycobacteroides abscessus subsp. abscessus]
MGRVRTRYRLAETKTGRYQRRIGFDVGAHDEDVARLQCGVVGKQAQQHLAQHIDLTCRAVAGMHLHRMIVRRERPALRTHLVGRQIGLQPTQQ